MLRLKNKEKLPKGVGQAPSSNALLVMWGTKSTVGAAVNLCWMKKSVSNVKQIVLRFLHHANQNVRKVKKA